MFDKIKKRRERRIKQKSDRLKKQICERTRELGACNNECVTCAWYVEDEE